MEDEYQQPRLVLDYKTLGFVQIAFKGDCLFGLDHTGTIWWRAENCYIGDGKCGPAWIEYRNG